jgi:hypothetical protein
MRTEVNPEKDGASLYSRLFSVKTPEEVRDEFKGVIGIDASKTTVTCHGGEIVIVVNEQDKIVEAYDQSQVDVEINDAVLLEANLRVDSITLEQQIRHTFSDFVYESKSLEN